MLFRSDGPKKYSWTQRVQASVDSAIRRLAPVVTSFVTEPLDPDESHGVEKRRMQASLHACLGTRPGDARTAVGAVAR